MITFLFYSLQQILGKPLSSLTLLPSIWWTLSLCQKWRFSHFDMIYSERWLLLRCMRVFGKGFGKLFGPHQRKEASAVRNSEEVELHKTFSEQCHGLLNAHTPSWCRPSQKSTQITQKETARGILGVEDCVDINEVFLRRNSNWNMTLKQEWRWKFFNFMDWLKRWL